MEPELVALASAAGTATVSLLATDAWKALKAGLSGLWRRAHPERAERVAVDLAEARRDLITAQTNGDPEVERLLVAEWQARIGRLLAAAPSAAPELRRLLFELGTAGAATTGMQVAIATGGSVVTQAGGDVRLPWLPDLAGDPRRDPRAGEGLCPRRWP